LYEGSDNVIDPTKKRKRPKTNIFDIPLRPCTPGYSELRPDLTNSPLVPLYSAKMVLDEPVLPDRMQNRADDLAESFMYPRSSHPAGVRFKKTPAFMLRSIKKIKAR